MMQKLRRIWLAIWKLTWGTWWILTWPLENLKTFRFIGFLLNKAYNVWAKKSIGKFCLMTLNIDATFERKLTCAFKNDMRNLANFNQSMFESLKLGTFMGSFYPKKNMYEFKIYREVLLHDNEEWWKIEEELTCQFKIDMRNWQILTRELENPKNLHFNRLLLTKVYNAWPKKRIEELCLIAWKIDAKFEWGLTCAF